MDNQEAKEIAHKLHRLTSTLQDIVDEVRELNKNMKALNSEKQSYAIRIGSGGEFGETQPSEK